MNVKDTSGEILDKIEKQVIGNWKKGRPCHKAEKNLVELYPTVLWKAELGIDEAGYLAEKISKQSVKGVAWLLLAAYSKI